MLVQNDYPQMYVLEGRVCFDRQRRQLHTPEVQVELKENEARLLCALLEGVQDKRQIIEILWESRGVIVTENNYYKVVKGLRNAFAAIGLSADLLKTLPRVGLAYVGGAKPLLAEPSAPEFVEPLPPLAVAEPLSQPADSGEPVPAPAAHLVSWWRRVGDVDFLFTLLILLMGLLCGRLLFMSDNGFRLLGRDHGVRIYVYKDPGVTQDEVLARTQRFAVDPQANHYLYYRSIGKNYIILACPTALPDGAESCVSLMQKNI
jgi:DNA-binding winged helix-turn-helix (wHTH) protein